MKFKYIFFLFFFFPNSFASAQTYSLSDSAALKYLKENAIYSDDFVRTTFYTWTTPEQIAELRKTKTLLTKSKSETRGYSHYDISLRDSTLKNNAVAQLLSQNKFAKKRFAWTNSWATIMGWKDESYGNQLIKIVLNDSAIVGSFNARENEPFSFYDVRGNKLTQEFAVQNSSRIAAIFHIGYIESTRTQETKKRKGTFYRYTGKFKKEKVHVQFREYILINENMIASWSYGTDKINFEFKTEQGLLTQLQSSNRANQKGYRYDKYYTKSYMESNYGLQEYFETNKCFNNDYYLFNKVRLSVISKKLQKALESQSAPIVK